MFFWPFPAPEDESMVDPHRGPDMHETLFRNQPFENISGCIVAEKIHESPHTLVYRGRRQRDDFPVVLKILYPEYPTSEERLAFQTEYEITQSLEIEGVIGVYGLEKHRNTFAMLLEDIGALSLDLLIPKGMLSIKEILKTAAEMAAILGRIHAAGVIHKGINPSNILYNRKRTASKSLILVLQSASRMKIHPSSARMHWKGAWPISRLSKPAEWHGILTGEPIFIPWASPFMKC